MNHWAENLKFDGNLAVTIYEILAVTKCLKTTRKTYSLTIKSHHRIVCLFASKIERHRKIKFVVQFPHPEVKCRHYNGPTHGRNFEISQTVGYRFRYWDCSY